MSRDHWTPEFLDAMRLVGDPPADAVVAELFAGGANVVHAVNYLTRDLVGNDDVPSRALPEHVRDYFAATPLPAGPNRCGCTAAASCSTVTAGCSP